MAPLIWEMYQHLKQQGTIDELDLRVIPGISAFQKAASVLGAPIGYDICIISLSDLMTPWEKIEKRIEAFGAGSPEGCFFEVEPSNTHYMLVRIARPLLYRGVCEMGDFGHESEKVGFVLPQQLC